ncbi:MAG TPA: metalloprotease PmbA [Gammaproteobacteria bacterium]|jgi:PmbA protein|nr:metalloprotease PmbA [Gammaproteobacteria bacterium]
MNTIRKLDINLDQLQIVSQDIMQEAKKAGADQCEVSISANKGFSVSVRNGDVEKIEYHQDKAIEINVYIGKRTGSTSVTDLSPASYKAAVLAACHIAKFTGEDPCGGLADKAELGFDYPQLTLAFPWSLSVEEAIALSVEGESIALQADKRLMSAEEVAIGTGESLYLYANSHGFIGHYPHTRHEMSCVLVAKQGEEMQRDFSYTTALDPMRLQKMSDIAKEAAKKTVGRLGARRLKTMRAPVIFIAEEARSLMGLFVSAMSGSRLYKKSSFLVDHLGKKIFPDFMTIQEDPYLADGLGSVPFDNDGVLARPNIFVQNGVLESYALGVYSARQLKLKTTGNAGGVHNLIVSPGDKDLKSLLRTMDKGLLVTEMMGNGTNLITGDYSRGASGFWVEGGEIQYPVHEITVAGKLQDMFLDIVAVGNDVDVRGGIRTGSVLIGNMMIAGD